MGGGEKAPVSGFLREPGASQTLSKCIVLAQLLLVKCSDGSRGMEAQGRQSPSRGSSSPLTKPCSWQLSYSLGWHRASALCCHIPASPLRLPMLLQQGISRAGECLPSPWQLGAARLAGPQLKCSASLPTQGLQCMIIIFFFWKAATSL